MAAMQRAVWMAAILVSVGLAVSGSATFSRGQQPGPKAQTAASAGEVERGRYLVEEVARCPECHTPRNGRGDLKRDQWLQGASIWITPVQGIPNWAERAPALAGLPSYTDEQAERILEQGTGPEGETLRAPMHTYHLTRADAKAIIAYLRSLPRGARPQGEP
jgi:mono/diheme cytochrome c family protein